MILPSVSLAAWEAVQLETLLPSTRRFSMILPLFHQGLAKLSRMSILTSCEKCGLRFINRCYLEIRVISDREMLEMQCSGKVHPYQNEHLSLSRNRTELCIFNETKPRSFGAAHPVKSFQYNYFYFSSQRHFQVQLINTAWNSLKWNISAI